MRTATLSDTGRLAEMISELVDSLLGARGGAELIGDRLGTPDRSLGPQDDLASMIFDERRLVLVGSIDRVTVGMGLWRRTAADVGSRGILDACYVDPEARGVGLGRLLMEAGLTWCAEMGCHAVDGLALPGDRVAKNFYEVSGFKARLLTMHRSFE
ncbi:MAG: GNAT family N-acetyltransferase [Acidimicrobiales bacterium]